MTALVILSPVFAIHLSLQAVLKFAAPPDAEFGGGLDFSASTDGLLLPAAAVLLACSGNATLCVPPEAMPSLAETEPEGFAASDAPEQDADAAWLVC